jgi:cytochrome c-type biogenesis protein CcmH
MSTPEQEQRIKALQEKLRCLVCQNQTLADSNADLAQDLRLQLVEQVKAGRSDGQIVEYMVQRYGDFVLYDPPFKATTAALWIGPFLLLLLGVVLLVIALRRRRAAAEDLPLAPDERRVVDQVLGGPPGGGRP